MRGTFLLLAAISALPVAAQDRPDAEEPIVVITATPLAQTQARLAACIARHCPPREDIDASLAHAENQFLAGDYAAARHTLGRSRARNGRYAAELPVEVSDLHRAYGRLSNLDGRLQISRIAQIESIEALKAGLDSNDARVLMQRLMIGDEYARAGRLRAAEDVYRKVARQARKAGELHVLGHAMMRDAVVFGAIASVAPEYRQTAEDKIARIEDSDEPQLAGFRDAAKLLRASLAGLEGDLPALEKAIATVNPQKFDKPLLIYAPSYSLEDDLTPNQMMPTSAGAPEWIDLRFRIGADGTVHNVEILRDSGNLGRDWAKSVSRAVAGRRYAPLALPAGSEGVTRVERFSYIHDVMSATHTRIRGRGSRGRLTSLDITADPKPES